MLWLWKLQIMHKGWVKYTRQKWAPTHQGTWNKQVEKSPVNMISVYLISNGALNHSLCQLHSIQAGCVKYQCDKIPQYFMQWPQCFLKCLNSFLMSLSLLAGRLQCVMNWEGDSREACLGVRASIGEFSVYISTLSRGWGLCQYTECLQSKQEDLRSETQHPHKILGMAGFVTPVLGRWRQEDAWELLANQASQIGAVHVWWKTLS